ncbi:MAG: STAS domain-containing protein [Pseudonocardia sp.]|nr:STAS domain-containing protein [Pseudonocardia sp.]
MSGRSEQPLRIELTTGDGCVRVVLRGELSHHSAPALERRVRSIPETDGPDLELDVSDLTFCDSAGLATIIGVQRRAARRGGSVVLRGVQGALQRVLETTGAGVLFPAHPGQDSRMA